MCSILYDTRVRIQ